jgi:arsenite methyltransferase
MATPSTRDSEGLGTRGVVRSVERRGLAATIALILSLIACYGTLAAVALLSALGVTLTLNTGIWAGAIVLFAVLATVIIGLGIRKHGSVAPLAPALAGTALITYVMFVQFDRILELVAFALLAVAVYWDYRLRARAGRPE